MGALDFRSTRLSFARPISSYAKVQALVGLLIRNRLAFAKIKGEGAYVDLGCGPNTDASFCNVDYNWRPDIDVCWDITKGLPFATGSIHGIFSEHMLEHLSLLDAIAVLKDCRRVLGRDRVLRIVVPDGELYLNEYAKHAQGLPSSIPYAENDTGPIVSAMTSVNRIFRDHGHLFIWDYETLRKGLLGAGFTDVQRMTYQVGRDPKLLRDSAHRRIESLYVEAT